MPVAEDAACSAGVSAPALDVFVDPFAAFGIGFGGIGFEGVDVGPDGNAASVDEMA